MSDPVGHHGDVPAPHAGSGGAKSAAKPAASDPTYSPQAQAYYKALAAQQSQANVAAAGLNIPSATLNNLPPDVRNVFVEAQAAAGAGSPWQQDQFTQALMNTQWWKTTSPGARNFAWDQVFDPAKATQTHNTAAFSMIQQAAAMGIHMTLQQADTMARQSIGENWDANRTQYEIANMHLGSGNLGPGQIETNVRTIKGIANDYGISVAPLAAIQWGQRMAAGTTDQQAFTDYAQHQAAINHPYWAKEIATGATVRQLADPWIQTASRLLEVDPGQVDLTQPKWNFTTHDPKAGTTPMSQSAWAQKIMTDNQYGWDKTQNAHQAAFGMVDQLRQTFGAQ